MNNEMAAALAIRSGIEILDELARLREEAGLGENTTENESMVPGYPHISLGSRDHHWRSISAVIADAPDEFKMAYQNLNRKIADRLLLAGAAEAYIRSFPLTHQVSPIR